MILLDTNVVSETMRPAPERRVVEWLDSQAAETLHLSSVSLAELRYGIACLPRGKRKESLEQTLTETVELLFGNRVLAFDASAAGEYAFVMSRARRAGRTIGVADGQIAAIASLHGLMIATRDKSPFDAAGVQVVDPWA